MTAKIVRITGSGFVKTGAVTDGHPVEFRHWQEVVNEAEFMLESAVNSEEEEAVVELWLEDPMSFQAYFDEENGATPMGPGAIKTGMIHRADNFNKQAKRPASNWDQEFADAKKHAHAVLSNLGNAK